MRKYLLISLALIALGGIVYATVAPSRFPTTTGGEFPSMPTQPGTIGYILSLFDPNTGTARNTERLGGKLASEYLKNKSCNPLEVWVGIDADGYPICGTRTPYLVGNFSEISAGVKLIKPDHSEVTPVVGVTRIEEGDLVQTNGGTGTIQFAQDASYIRLDSGTTVELRRGSNTLGQTVAEAILADGQLWGRIMTSTGVNLGGGGLVAGVRGTSVMIKKDLSTQKVTLAIVDSTSSTSAATVTNTNTSSNASTTLNRGQQIVADSGATTTPSPTTPGKTTLLTNTWVQKNTLSDIVTLATLSGSTTVAPATLALVRAELTTTVPPAGTTGAIPNTAYCPTGKTLWSSLALTVHDICQPIDLVAFADYTKNPQDKKMYLKSGETIPPDSGNNYTLPNTLSGYFIYAFGNASTKLVISNDEDGEIITNNGYYNIGSKFKWSINLDATNRLEIR